MLGGPVGGAIGSLIGQSFDQQIFGGGLRKGPRLGDLAVQTSTYGTAIPRIYGTMRVAGSLVWATDLKESATLVGAKGQPQSEVYSYSVSMAVALSSRPVRAIKRIWADGKLLRGAAGDFKVKTKFRFYDGGETQPLDPLIASLEGMGMTPAYRGLALAVFEDLELGEHGNRIPFLTFEVDADDPQVPVRNILSDASGGLIACTAAGTLAGYAAHGAGIGASVEPLIDCFAIDLFDDGQRLITPDTDNVHELSASELGCGTEGGAARVERSIEAAESVPASILLTYYDAQRDYQTGQQRASVGSAGPEAQLQIPAVAGAAEARSVAEMILARRWARRDRATVTVPPSRMDVRAGEFVTLQGDPKLWRVERSTIEAKGVRLELRSVEAASTAANADHGRATSAVDVVASPTVLALFDLPLPGNETEPVIHVAAASASPGWRPIGVRVDVGGEPIFTSSAPRETVLGVASGPLGIGSTELFDELNSVDVQLVDPSHWLTSCTDAAMLNGSNLAAIGDEILQFATVQPLGNGAFRLSRLLRGRRGTEWAVDEHATGEPFVLLQSDMLRAVALPMNMRGATVGVTALGVADANAATKFRTVTGEALRPPSPVHLDVTVGAESDIHATWVRRSRHGWDWVDEVDAPIGESQERYRILVEGQSGSLELESSMPGITISHAALTAAGVGPATLSVKQIGDRALSRPAIASFEIV